jgi:hypothetical protein
MALKSGEAGSAANFALTRSLRHFGLMPHFGAAAHFGAPSLGDVALLVHLHGVYDQAGHQTQDDKIEDHLNCDDNPSGLTLCRDVTGSDCREDGG